ncbi:MAG: DUF3419 family protein [Minisyncoccia bacterium]|jgi:S-adenosylmethionine:diacylglycerol 3-amino-3-carboxypropyl transferase
MHKIYFSSVWEDYASLKEACQPSENDVVLTVSSSGDNVFNFLADKVKKVIAVDINLAQLSLAKLKLEIIRRYEREKVLELFTGMGDKHRNGMLVNELISSEREFKEYLTSFNFDIGIENIGQFETKVISILTFFVRSFFRQADFQHNENRRRNRGICLNILLAIFSFKKIYKFLIPDFPYEYINIDTRESLKNSLDTFLANNDFSNNWYLQKVYYGHYKLSPPFLRPDNFEYIKKNAERILFVRMDMLDYLRESEDNSIDKINFSDIFDWCSQEEYSRILQESYRVLTPNGLIFYRELFVSRKVPPTYKK